MELFNSNRPKQTSWICPHQHGKNCQTVARTILDMVMDSPARTTARSKCIGEFAGRWWNRLCTLPSEPTSNEFSGSNTPRPPQLSDGTGLKTHTARQHGAIGAPCQVFPCQYNCTWKHPNLRSSHGSFLCFSPVSKTMPSGFVQKWCDLVFYSILVCWYTPKSSGNFVPHSRLPYLRQRLQLSDEVSEAHRGRASHGTSDGSEKSPNPFCNWDIGRGLIIIWVQ